MSKLKSRLGRGLNSLISVSGLPISDEVAPAETTATSGIPPANRLSEHFVEGPKPVAGLEMVSLAPDTVSPNPHQPRKAWNEASLADLASSLKATGLVQPIIVRRLEDGRYQLIAGERRLRASKLAGLETIPAIVRQVDSWTQAQMALIENIHREDLNPVDRATSYRGLIDQLGLTQAELATRLGEDRSTVANHLRLLELAEPVRDAVRSGTLSLGHAKLLAGVTDILEQQRLGELAVAQGLSVRNLERLVQQPIARNDRQRPAKVSTAHIAQLESSLTQQVGLRVQVKSVGTGDAGRIIIHYKSLDDFDDLAKKLGATLTAD